MRYLHKYESHEDIVKLCKRYHIVNYTINTDGSIDVDDNVDLSYRKLEKFLLKFRDVGDDFHCYNNRLTNLEGCPKSVGGSFNCNDNELTSLEGCPRYVGNNFICAGNKLKSLEGCPKTIDGILDCYHNKLT
jgi:hypothetical protein